MRQLSWFLVLGGTCGLVACTDAEVAERVRMLRFHGSLDKKTFELVGTNSRLDAIHAAALRVFLPQLAGWTEYFYKRNGEPVLRDLVIGGHPALEAVFPVLIRPTDPPTAVAYWAVKHADTLYVFRVGFPPGREPWPLLEAPK